MSEIYATRWRLIYLDGRTLDESPFGGTILERWPDPIELHLIDFAGESVMRVPLPPGYQPVFYRKKTMAMQTKRAEDKSAFATMDSPALEAIVFGYGRIGVERVEGKLWAWRQGRAVDCPAEHISERAIETQVTV